MKYSKKKYLLGFTRAYLNTPTLDYVYPLSSNYARGYDDAKKLRKFMETINYENIRNT